ncbi:MAG: glycoside hydrolase family 47 protein [Ferruginibacter sp.]|nr:glycoside hydrolase family 47 protein [Ferruginibacter sp.]MBU9936742.1 glycoside hydrolase family 47 protein [Ferruginibacter sp.]
MKKIMLTTVILFLAAAVFAQGKDAKFTDSMKQEMCSKVKEAASHAWKGYKDHAWGADDLKPLTKQPKNWYKTSMLMTPVDAFDTFTLMGLTAEAKEAKDLILGKLDFNIDNDVQVFEITIRLLGGLITAYELDGNKKFLALAHDLGNRLMPAFHTPTGMPYRYVHLQTGKTRDGINNPAEIGTLMMEFGKLSKLTGDSKYYDAAKKAILAVYKNRSPLGLVGEQIDVQTGKWVTTKSHIGAYIDSYYEYLYKNWLLFGDLDFKTAFDTHNKAIKEHLISKTGKGWFMHQVDMNSGKVIGTTYGALEAFYAGLCAFAGDVETGRQIQEANYYMWTRFNLEPEEFNFIADTITSAYYILRPENLESAFYMYRLTGELKYLWQGKVMVESILTHCRNDVGFASLKNVQTFEKTNSMESFFFGETLKYAYLIFAPVSALDLKKVVLTTEAHPFKTENRKTGISN